MGPADDPVPYLLAGGRRARAGFLDGLWVRLVSVPGALTRRRYACAVDVVIDVADELFAENAGRWRLQAGGPADGAGPPTPPPAPRPAPTAPAPPLPPAPGAGGPPPA